MKVNFFRHTRSFIYVCHKLHRSLWNNTYLPKDFKNKYKSLKGKEIHIFCYQKPHDKKTFFLSTERENQIQSNTSLLLVTKFAYLVNFNLILRNPFYKSWRGSIFAKASEWNP